MRSGGAPPLAPLVRCLPAALAAVLVAPGPGGAPAAAVDTGPDAPAVDPSIDRFSPDPELQGTPDAEHAAREVTSHEHTFWAPTWSFVKTVVVRDATACSLPDDVVGPSAEGGRGVQVTGAFPVGEGLEAVPLSEPTVHYADPDDLVIELEDELAAPPGETVTITIECRTADGQWAEVGTALFPISFGTDVLPIGMEFPTTVDFGPVVENGRVPLSLADLPTDGPVSYSISELDIADVRAELDGAPATVEGTGKDGEVVFPPDAGPGLHMLTLAYADPAVWEVTVPVINGYAAPAPPAAPSEAAQGDGDGVPHLEDLRTDPVTLLIALAVTTAVVSVVWLLVGFPSDIFNKSLEGNQGRIRSWWQRLRTLITGRRGGRRALLTPAAGTAFVVFWILSAALPVLLNQNPDPEATPLLDFLGLMIAVFVVTVVYAWVVNARDWAWSQVPGRFEVLPGGLVIVALCSLVSAAADFEPGYFYGLIAGFAAIADRRSKLEMPEAEQDAFVRENEGRATRLGAYSVLALSIVCYLFWNSLSSLVEDGGAPFGVQLMDKALFSVTLLGVQTVVFGLLPMRYLDGHRLWRWGRLHWALAFVPGLFVFVYLLHMHPDQVAGKTVPGSLLATASLFIGFGGLSLAVWAFFVWRARRASAHRPQAVAVGASTAAPDPASTGPAASADTEAGVPAEQVEPAEPEETEASEDDRPVPAPGDAGPSKEPSAAESAPVPAPATEPDIPATGVRVDDTTSEPTTPNEPDGDNDLPSDVRGDAPAEPAQARHPEPPADDDGPDPAIALDPEPADAEPPPNEDLPSTEERSGQA
ncbi:FGLLP motif-containing membrane protein [Nocardiopsis sp. YSL2]|uniref:FGLLP motif-containing membrane protein n=1 Tax=Nocardiopsis sp. YSL2 TaxID=2939492 RepID=UPI0026F4277D|nr:FGLLP motif-containing membrane protein [Nocardiopsis sp. YSL2]